MSWAKNPLEFSKTSVFSESLWGGGTVPFPGLHEGLFVSLVWTILWNVHGNIIQLPPSMLEKNQNNKHKWPHSEDTMSRGQWVWKRLRSHGFPVVFCNRVYRVKMKVVDVVETYLSLLMEFLFPLNCGSVSRLSHGTQHRYTLTSRNDFPPPKLLKRHSQTQQTFPLSEKLE